MRALKQTNTASGDCYPTARSAAFDLWLLQQRGDPRVKEVRLVHGTIVPRLGDAADRRIDHAWVELNGDTVIERSNGNDIEMSKQRFVDLLQAVEEARYSVEETYKKLSRTKHCGPWHK